MINYRHQDKKSTSLKGSVAAIITTGSIVKNKKRKPGDMVLSIPCSQTSTLPEKLGLSKDVESMKTTGAIIFHYPGTNEIVYMWTRPGNISSTMKGS